jgi:hypothetical protein
MSTGAFTFSRSPVSTGSYDRRTTGGSSGGERPDVESGLA